MRAIVFYITFLLTGSYCHAQYIIAGDSITEAFVDINPDIVRNACSASGCYSIKKDTIDLDNDGIDDYVIWTGGTGGLGGGARGTYIESLNGNLLLRGRTDSLYSCSGTLHLEEVAKVNVDGDTIKLTGDFFGGNQNLNFYSFALYSCYAITIYDFANADQYVAVKFHSGGGIRLGWIKFYIVDQGGVIKTTVRSYAYTDSVFVSVPESQGNDVSAKIFPNPFTEQSLLVVEGGMKELRDVVLRDAYGRAYRVNYEITQSGILLNRENLPSGVYFLCFTTEKGRGSVKIVAR